MKDQRNSSESEKSRPLIRRVKLIDDMRAAHIQLKTQTELADSGRREG